MLRGKFHRARCRSIRVRRLLRRITSSLILALLAARLGAVILLDTGDPEVNTTPPSGALTGSGWQYQGAWGGVLGTPIAPHFFLSAAHVGRAGSTFLFQGSSYTIVQSFNQPGSD